MAVLNYSRLAAISSSFFLVFLLLNKAVAADRLSIETNGVLIEKESENDDSESEGNNENGINFICSLCSSYKTSSKVALCRHLLLHENGALACEMCQFEASSVQELKEHEALEHTGKPLYKCDTCDTSFFSLTIFQRHSKRHNIVQCKVCTDEFQTEAALQEHVDKKHTLNGEFFCHLCNKKFLTGDRLRSHYKKCSGGFVGYVCCLCSQRTVTIRKLRLHAEDEHKVELFICYVCGVSFVQEEELNIHESTHIGKVFKLNFSKSATQYI